MKFQAQRCYNASPLNIKNENNKLMYTAHQRQDTS